MNSRNDTSPKCKAEPYPSKEAIAACAHLIWEQEGRPEGRAAEHWKLAEAQLSVARARDQRPDAARNLSACAIRRPPPPREPLRMMMRTRELDFEMLMEIRLRAITQSVWKITISELDALMQGLLPRAVDLWKHLARRLRNECRTDVLHLADAGFGIRVIYCRKRHEGVWFQPGGAIGLVKGAALAAMKDLVDDLEDTDTPRAAPHSATVETMGASICTGPDRNEVEIMSASA